MHNLLILSRDADQYRQLIDESALSGLTISQCVDHPAKVNLDLHHTMMLAEPDLAKHILPKCADIRWVQSTWAGVKPLVDLNLPNVRVTGIKDVFGLQMQEYVFTYILHFAREVERFQQLQKQRHWVRPVAEGLSAKRIGILGLGSIGLEVAKTAKHFNMQVVGISRSAQPKPNVDRVYSISQAAEFAPNLDYLVSLLPHTVETEHLINQDFLALLPAHCVLINAGRGQVIDEAALCSTLMARKLKAAVLDVFENEPLPTDHPFWQMENVMITQHSAAISKPTEIVNVFIDNVQRYQQNLGLRFEIDVTRGY
ncbi:D-2-hydroxyacid dehydrogenase [Aliiglaciecola litoralis]|uniref:D-2-hydroxyacid dehydrogenase n=1 Tax=Aliiglaciecola litoralis TaxID=582857 RepID=A0ABN1LSF4_9ALTE